MNESQKDNLVLLQKILVSLEESKVPSIDPAQISLVSKTAFKIATFRETMLWRYCELLKGIVAVDGLNLPAVILCRSSLEVATISCYFANRLTTCVENSNISDADELVTQMILGSKVEGWGHQAVNILTTVEHTEREFAGVRKIYGSLSEYTHPNWHGSVNLFANNDVEKLITNFGIEDRKNNDINGLVASAFKISAIIAGSSFDRVADLIPEFSRLHEEKISALSG